MNAKPLIHLLAFDADDTLWVNEPIYAHAEKKLEGLLRPYLKNKVFADHLYEMEIRNLDIFGYGIKGFTLSMIETAIELTDGQVPSNEFQQIIEIGKEMLAHPVELLPSTLATIKHLSADHELMVITKGDLFDQENKLARSGVADLFQHLEVVSEKNEPTYAKLLEKYHVKPENFLMVGNSLRSDVLPVVKIGGHAVHIPFKTTWQHEQVEESALQGQVFFELRELEELGELLAESFQLQKRPLTL